MRIKSINYVELRKMLLVLIAITIGVIFLYPVLIALFSAFRTNGDILKDPMGLPSSFYLDNFKTLLTESDFVIAIRNSVILTVVSISFIICVVPMAAYGIERWKSRKASFIYLFFISGLMIPFHLYMFPLFKQMKMMHIYGTMAAPIVFYVSAAISLGSLLYCSFIRGIPLEIEEAARIDGCSPSQTFWRVTFPLLKPCTGTMVILNGLGIWNDYLLPYLVLPSDKPKTITVEIASFVGQYTAGWNIVFAGTIISITPALIIFIMFQKYFAKGITSGAIKG